MKVSLTDEQVIAHYLPNQPAECFGALYSRYVNKVYKRCLVMTKDAEKAQDYTQDIFLKVYTKLDSFEQKASFSTWLYSISRNYCTDQLRVAKRFPTTSLDDTQTWHSTDTLDDQRHEESLQFMQQAMGSLSASERNLLRLKYEKGLSIEEIAQSENLNASAVKMRIKRSRDKVKTLCARYSE